MKRLHGFVTPNMTMFRGKLMNHWVLAPKSDMVHFTIRCWPPAVQSFLAELCDPRRAAGTAVG